VSILSKTLSVLKRYFVSGVLVVVPLILTYIVLKFMFEAVDGLLQPLFHGIFGYFIPGLGVLTTLLIIILAGILTRNFIGAMLYDFGDRILARLPIIRTVYMSTKQLIEAVSGPAVSSFKEVALVEYPRRGAWALSFVSNRIESDVEGVTKKFVALFIPSTPTPISGMIVLVPAEDVVVVDMTIEEGIKFLVSGGVASPDNIRRREIGDSPLHAEVKDETR
jgi:uncharacterized membrane protein